MAKYYYYALFDNKNKSHRYLLSLCRQLGWTTHHLTYGVIPDLERLGRFIAHDCRHKIPIRSQTPKQLQVTIHQLEQVQLKPKPAT